MRENILTRVLVLFFITAAVIVAVAIYTLQTLSHAVAGSDWVNHTYATIFECEHLSARLQQADGMMRTYLLSGDQRDLASAREAFVHLDEHFENAKALTRNDPEAHAVLQRIEEQAREREVLAEELWAAKAANDSVKVETLLAADAGSPVLATLQNALGRLRDAQFTMLSERDHVAYLQMQKTRWVVNAGIGVNFLLLMGIGWLLRDDIKARRLAAAALAEANVQLEDKVRQRTSELQKANAQLRTENLERRWTITSQTHQLRYNQLIVDSVAELVLVLTKAQTVTRINPAVVQLTGRLDEAILTRPLSELVEVPLDPVSGLDPLGRALLEGRELRRNPVTVLCHDGRRIPALLTLLPIKDEDKIVGGVAMVQIRNPSSSGSAQLS